MRKIFILRTTKENHLQEFPTEIGMKQNVIEFIYLERYKIYFDQFTSKGKAWMMDTEHSEYSNIDEDIRKNVEKEFRVYKQLESLAIEDFVVTTDMPRHSRFSNQNFSIALVESISSSGNYFTISSKVINTKIAKDYNNKNEVSALMGAGKIHKLNPKFYPLILARGLGIVKYLDNYYIPINIDSSTNEDRFNVKFSTFNTITNEIENKLAGDEHIIEIDLHSPGRILLKISEAAISHIGYILEDVDGNRISLDSATNPMSEMYLSNLVQVEIVSENDLSAKVTIIDDLQTGEVGNT